MLASSNRESHTKVPGCFRVRRAVLGEQALCHKGPPNRYTAGRGVSFTISSGEKRRLEMLLEKKEDPGQSVRLCVSFCILPHFLSRPSKMSLGEDVTALPSLLVSSCECLRDQVL